MTLKIDKLDKKILDVVQRGLPVKRSPFKLLASKVGLSEEEIVERLRRLRENGIIRRFGAVFDSGKMGFVSTLLAAHVPQSRIDKVVQIINEYPGVTHNYEREHYYNLWFTLSASSGGQLNKLIDEIERKTKIKDLKTLKAKRVFKISSHFEV
jgi:DNA-binding Lrp family transcriptional regulator